MNHPRLFLIALLAALALGRAAVRAETSSPDLDAEKIKALLRTMTVEENGFVDRVLKMVSDGRLPSSLVDSTLQWARKKPYKHRFQYFKQALIVRAAAIGITIKP